MVSKYTLYDGRNLYVGLSTDSKPTDAKNGDIFNATNVGSTEVYDGTNWRIQTGDNSIPTPTAEDNGKALMVNNGSYALQNIPTEVPTPAIEDAGKAIVVNNSGEYELGNVGALICTDTNETLDKTMGEIQAAAQAGVPVVVLQTDNMNVAMTVVYVHQGLSATYTGQLQLWGGISYGVTETTEADALAAYPIYQPK